jgi:threonine/homoserine/homoserine lactone efflux protein
VIAFLGVALLVIVTPGPDTALTIRNALLGGRKGGAFTALGVSAGQAAWATATALGLAALLRASEPAFLAVRSVGAAYLVYLGAHALWSACRREGRPGSPVRGGGPRLAPRAAFRQGLISNLGNPKMAVFFTSLLPQFGGSSPASLVGLGLVLALLTLTWLTAYAVAVARAGRALLRPRVRRALEAATGVALVGLGLRLARERS